MALLVGRNCLFAFWICCMAEGPTWDAAIGICGFDIFYLTTRTEDDSSIFDYYCVRSNFK